MSPPTMTSSTTAGPPAAHSCGSQPTAIQPIEPIELDPPEFRSYLGAVIDDGSSHVVVDLAETSFIDSSGLGALIGVLKRARSEGGDLRIAAPSEQVRMVLGLTNLDRVLRPHESLDEATRGW